MKNFNTFYFIAVVEEVGNVIGETGDRFFLDSKREVKIIVDFFLKFGWLPKKKLHSASSPFIAKEKRKKIFDEMKDKKTGKVIKKPTTKLFVWKSIMRIRKRPKEIGGNIKEVF